jgi:hypothetical protein
VFAYYAGDLSLALWLASALILILFVRHTSIWFLSYLSILLLFFSTRVFLLDEVPPEDFLRDIRFFWGFVLFLPFFISEKRQLGNRFTEYNSFFRLFVSVCLILLLIEYITANTLFLEWPNRSHELAIDLSDSAIARAYGFGGNASVTSVLLVALSTILYVGKYMRDIATLGLATSGTGLVVLLIKLSSSINKQYIFLTVATLGLLYLGIWSDILNIEMTNDIGAFSKFGITYFDYLIDYKYEQFQDVMKETNKIQLIFGQTFMNKTIRTGDFQALDFLAFNGLFGAGMLILVVARYINQTNRLPLLCVLIGSFHYQVVFSLPGQILFAWLLTVGTLSSPNRNKSSTSLAKISR